MLMCPVLVAFETLGPTVYAIVALPDPDEPFVMSIHGESVDAVHAHVAESAVVKLPPAPGAFCVDGARPRTHGTTPGCTTTSCADDPPPATVIMPVRVAVVVFAATE